MAGNGQQVPSLRRAIDLLEAVARTPDGMTAGALEHVVDGSRSGLYALLATLRARGWLAQDDAGAYHVGPALRRIVPPSDHDDHGLQRALRDAIEDLGSSEAVALVRPDGADRIVIASHGGAHVVRCVYRVGQARTGAGPDAAVLAPTAPPEDLLASAGVVRTQDDQAIELGAPVCRDGRHPVAAVLVGVPRQRATPTHLDAVTSALRALAVDTSLRLGAPDWQPWGRWPGEGIGPRRVLDDGEVAELLGGRHRAQLACLRDDGSPHVVPLWFDWDGTHLWFTASPGASWAGYVGPGSRISLTVEEPRPALRRVFVTGWAEPVESEVVAAHVEGGVDGLRRRLLQRHLGRHEAAATLDPAPGWTAIRVRPDRIHGRAGLAREAA